MSRAAWFRWSIMVLVAMAGLALWVSLPEPPPVVRVGLLPFAEVNSRVVAGFKQVLAEQGFREGETVQYRTAPVDGDIERLPGHIAELLAWEPDLLLVSSTPPSQAAYRATLGKGIPMIFAPVSDPLAAKIVGNLQRPGEHVTGIRLAPSNGLRLQWFKRVQPHLKNCYVPYSSNDRSALATIEQIRSAADDLGVRLLLRPVADPAEIERAAREIPAAADAIFLPQDSRIESAIDQFVAASMARRLPLSAPSVLQVERGALMSFGFDHYEIGRQAGRLAAEILAGVAPGDLPVETAENRLYVNLQAARAIGLTIDDAVLRQAHRVVRVTGLAF